MARLQIQYDRSSPQGRRRRGRVAHAISTFGLAGALLGSVVFMPATASAGEPPAHPADAPTHSIPGGLPAGGGASRVDSN